MRIELGELVRALEGWRVCIDECDRNCTVCVWLPGWARRLSHKEQVLLALYLAARATMDYRVVAAMHIYSLQKRVALRPEIYVRAKKEAKVKSRITPRIEDDSPYAWEAVLYRGLLYAQTIKSTAK